MAWASSIASSTGRYDNAGTEPLSASTPRRTQSLKNSSSGAMIATEMAANSAT